MASFTELTSDQMETLSEIIFGLTITFSAIQFAFSPPVHLADILGLVTEFGISFTLLIWVWLTYIRNMRNLRREGSPPVFLNIALLLFATVEPYLLYIVWLGTFQTPNPDPTLQLSSQLAAAAWAVDVGLVLIVLGLVARRRPVDLQGPNSDGLAASVRRYANWYYTCGIALALTAIPVFWVLLYSATFGDNTVGTFDPIVHLQLVLWVPIFILLGVGSRRYSREIDQALGRSEGVLGPSGSTRI